jgi:hypothetical protein
MAELAAEPERDDVVFLDGDLLDHGGVLFVD